MAYHNPNITGSYNPLYTLNNQGFFRGSCPLSSENAPGLPKVDESVELIHPPVRNVRIAIEKV